MIRAPEQVPTPFSRPFVGHLFQTTKAIAQMDLVVRARSIPVAYPFGKSSPCALAGNSESKSCVPESLHQGCDPEPPDQAIQGRSRRARGFDQ